MPNKREYWRKLDNAANMYSATSNKKITRVFRFYCELNEDVDEEILQMALEKTIQKYPIFLSVIRKGLFWHYLEKSSLRPKAHIENKKPCSKIYVQDKKSLLFDVSYYQNRINFEVFHVLTDGTGATQFLKELVKNYLMIAHDLPDIELTNASITIQDQESNAFNQYYEKEKIQNASKEKAFQIKKGYKKSDGLIIHEATLSVQELLTVSKAHHVSITEFVCAIMMMAIQKEMSQQEKVHQPVSLMVPVNLRNYFESNSMLNFFSYITPSVLFDREYSLDEILTVIHSYFQSELRPEKIREHMNRMIQLEKHPLLRLVPLEVKNLGIKAGSRYAERDVSAIVSNVGVVKMPLDYAQYISRFGLFTNTPKLELTMCSYQDTLTLSFTSIFDTLNIQRNFMELLKQYSVCPTSAEPEFPEVEQDDVHIWFRLYSFICLALIATCVAIHFSFDVSTNWTISMAAGVASAWAIIGVGFKKRFNLLKSAMWQLVLLSVGSVVWDWFIGWKGWSINYFIPVLCMFILLFMFIVSIARKDTAREYMIYFVMNCVFGMLVPLFFLVMGWIQYRMLSVFCVLFSFLFFVAIVMFKGKEFKEEMNKKFHW